MKFTLVSPHWKNQLINKEHREIIFRQDFIECSGTPLFKRYEKEMIRLYNEARIISKERKEISIETFEPQYQEWLKEK